MAIHCGRQNATITHFVKFMTTVFPLRIAEGMLSVTVVTDTSTADSKAVNVTRAEVMLCELIVEQNIPLAKSR